MLFMLGIKYIYWICMKMFCAGGYREALAEGRGFLLFRVNRIPTFESCNF